jgi:hypothetical protein
VLGAPLFPKVEVDTRGGTLVITREGKGAAPASASLAGVPVSNVRVEHEALVSAQDLAFETK